MIYIDILEKKEKKCWGGNFFHFFNFGFYFSYQFLDLLKSVFVSVVLILQNQMCLRKCCHPTLLKKIMNCVTFYEYPNSILKDKTYSMSIIGPVFVLVCSRFFNSKIYFNLVEHQILLMKLIFISFLLRVNFFSHK